VSIFVGILGLGFLVLIHEAGHFFAARAVGMRPRKFYLGFPPAIAKVTRRGIEYGIGAIPLGGYVKIPGMHRPAAGDVDHHFSAALGERSTLLGPLDAVKRELVAGDIDAAREKSVALTSAVEAADLSAAARTGAEQGLTDLDDATGPDAYWRQRAWKRVFVIFAGPGANLLFAIAIFAVLFMLGGGKATTTVGDVLAGTPAAKAGLRAGDKILTIDGKSVQPQDIPKIISGSQGHAVTVRIARSGGVQTIGPVQPKKTAGVYRLGFVLKGEGLSPPAAIKASVRLTGLVSKDIITSLANLVHQSGRKQISSPVGIVQGSSTAVQQGAQSYLWVLGLISLSLALLNLLPLLPLDGGHIFFSLLEGIRGRAVPRVVYERVSALGIALVLMLFFIGLSNDVGRLGGG
jgi:regulator of sigma E protease